MLKNKKPILIFLFFTTLIVVAMSLEVLIRQGIDGRYREIRMPLYVKWVQFLARHYEYKRLSKEITHGYGADEEKVLAILAWTRKNIRDVPIGMPVYDDHILYIIVRGYGVPEQFQDVFTTLSVYSGIPAFWRRIYDKDRKAKYALSFVDINGRWRIFDAYKQEEVLPGEGKLISVDDIVRDKPRYFRAQKQMPAKRIIFELSRFLRIEKEEDDP